MLDSIFQRRCHTLRSCNLAGSSGAGNSSFLAVLFLQPLGLAAGLGANSR